jgi:hypothetical protein
MKMVEKVFNGVCKKNMIESDWNNPITNISFSKMVASFKALFRRTIKAPKTIVDLIESQINFNDRERAKQQRVDVRMERIRSRRENKRRKSNYERTSKY